LLRNPRKNQLVHQCLRLIKKLPPEYNQTIPSPLMGEGEGGGESDNQPMPFFPSSDILSIILPEGPKEVEKVFNSPDREEMKRQHLLAFQDFCLDLMEEEYGKIPTEEKIDPRFVKGPLIRK
jgi:hypothetical protein